MVQVRTRDAMVVLIEENVVAPARTEALDSLHATLERFWNAVPGVLPNPPGHIWWLQFTTAVGEIGANIVRHAYPPGREPGTMALRLRLYRDRIEARFTDCGEACIVPVAAPSPIADDPLLLREGGFGLGIARAALDEFKYRRTRSGVNCWRLVKRFPDH